MMRELMIGNLEPEENVLPEFFKVTSEDPYIRHDYRLHYQNGDKKIFDNYTDCMQVWFSTDKKLLSHIEVLDVKNKKEKSKKGF